MAMIGPISPIAPLARMLVPSFVGRIPASPRIGSSVPIAVVVSAMATNRMPDVMSNAWRIVATPIASTSDVNQPITASVTGRPFTTSGSISKPARKMRKTSPISARKSMTSLSSAHPSTYGPSTMPSPISITTAGTRVHRLATSEMNGLSVAIDTISTSVRRLSGSTAAV